MEISGNIEMSKLHKQKGEEIICSPNQTIIVQSFSQKICIEMRKTGCSKQKCMSD